MFRPRTLLLAIVVLLALSAAPVAAQPGADCRDVDGFQVCGQFRAFVEANGDGAMLGNALSEQFPDTRLDTGIDLPVQYFEGGRLELHPENGDGPYAVQLGRLGAEVMAASGRDWFVQPQDDPSTPHYQPATGFAIAPEFIDSWSNNGVELGDAGVSYRESLALFGYPISTALVEDNGGGAVLTQWFERARFELRDGEVMLAPLGVETLDVPGVDAPAVASMLAQVQSAVARNASLARAQAGGWVLVDGLDHCFNNPGTGGMGFHYINTALLDLTLDPLAPEAMVYQIDADGHLRLGAVEWIVPAEPWDAEHPDRMPEVLGRMLHLNEALGVYVMHAWIFNPNPAGVFEDWNPNVTCPE